MLTKQEVEIQTHLYTYNRKNGKLRRVLSTTSYKKELVVYKGIGLNLCIKTWNPTILRGKREGWAIGSFETLKEAFVFINLVDMFFKKELEAINSNNEEEAESAIYELRKAFEATKRITGW
nr:hypothetical protein [uncultured Cellulosilyticum sp.]